MITTDEVLHEAATLCRSLKASIDGIELRKQAAEVRRQLWASLPAFERLASVWLFLASGMHDHYGQVLAAVFLLAGVHDMPAIHGKDAATFLGEFNQKYGSKAWHQKVDLLAKALPGGYGRKISDGMYKEALVLAKNPAKADNLVSKAFESIWKGGEATIKAGNSFSSAISYLKTTVRNHYINEYKRDKKHLHTDDPEKGPELVAPDMSDAHFYEKVLKDLHENPELARELNAIPKARGDAVKFLQLMAEGYDAKEIIGDYNTGTPSMLPHIDQSSKATGMTPQNWQAFIKPAIYKVVKHFYEREEA